MKKQLTLLLALLLLPLMVMAKADKQTVVFNVDLHCQGCVNKIMNNIAYEPGVKDIRCDLDTKTVAVTFDANKTNVPTLQKAFAKIGKPATTKAACSQSCPHHQEGGHTCPATDANTGATVNVGR